MAPNKNIWYFLATLLLTAALVVWLPVLAGFTLWMPGQSHKGGLPALTTAERQSSRHLRRHVQKLAGQIGERNNPRRYPELEAACRYISDTLTNMGYAVNTQDYSVDGRTVRNVVVEKKGSSHPEEIVVVGAHYDTVAGSPGADDNASGVAGVLELARMFASSDNVRTIRFVAFVNEEQPYFTGHDMGSWRYARRCRKLNENVVAMFAVEMIGYYSDEPHSQKYPPPLGDFYSSRGDFIGFIANSRSRDLLLKSIASFRAATKFPSRGIAAPEWTPGGIWRSDQGSFWAFDYPGIMITDSAEFRNPYYHSAMDTPDKLDYGRAARVVAGLRRTFYELANDRL